MGPCPFLRLGEVLVTFPHNQALTTTWEELQGIDSFRKVYYCALQSPLDTSRLARIRSVLNNLDQITAKRFMSNAFPAKGQARISLCQLVTRTAAVYPSHSPSLVPTCPQSVGAHHPVAPNVQRQQAWRRRQMGDVPQLDGPIIFGTTLRQSLDMADVRVNSHKRHTTLCDFMMSVLVLIIISTFNWKFRSELIMINWERILVSLQRKIWYRAMEPASRSERNLRAVRICNISMPMTDNLLQQIPSANSGIGWDSRTRPGMRDGRAHVA